MSTCQCAADIVSIGAATLMWGFILQPAVYAQVTPDGTLATTVTTTDNLNFVIDAGNRVNRNLFHSFEQFSIPTNGSAQFSNAIAIENIITRVTGSGLSDIDGLIQANGTASLFLLNPNGFIFGPNARLNIGGSFLVTTADSFLFEDDITFSASQAERLLSINIPLGLQMGAEPGSIEVLGSGHQLMQGNDLLQTTNHSSESLGLEVSSSQNLALLGSSLTLNGAVLTTAGGHIELGSARDGIIKFDDNNGNWVFSYDGASFDNIQLIRNALLDSSANQAGSMSLQGDQIRLSGGSTLLSQNAGNALAGFIQVYADESLIIRGVNSSNFRSSIRAEVLGSGQGSLIDIQSPLVRLKNGGAIRSTTFDGGDSGSIHIRAEEALHVEGISPIAKSGTDVSVIGATTIGGLGNAGDIDINSPIVRVRGGGIISSSTLAGEGTGGDILIEADSIRLEGTTHQIEIGGAGIFSSTLSDGNAGDIRINTRELVVLDGNIVDSASASLGHAGDLKISASEQVVVQGFRLRNSEGNVQVSAISSAVITLNDSIRQILDLSPIPAGDVGNLTIDTPYLRIADSGVVTINNVSGDGNPGQLNISAERVALENQGAITATTNTVSGGSITINAHILRLNNGRINASSLSSGRGGGVNLTVDDGLFLSNMSTISTRAGTVDSGGGDGGNIQIEAPFIVAAGNSDIEANAFTGNGGSIQITTQGLFNIAFRDSLTSNNDITASSEFGVSGTVSITTPDVDPGADAILLPSTVNDATDQVATACGESTSRSQFVVTGQGGLPTNPDGDGDRPWPNILPDFGTIPNSIADAPAPGVFQTSTAFLTPLLPQEASQMAIASSGKIQLISGTNPIINSIESNCDPSLHSTLK
ncbi:MAG: S-layer family protein [Cyanobacteria bacterium P01_F01_bin.150]